jgi:predicted TIM-barrel fold metal-dependent hydrolase
MVDEGFIDSHVHLWPLHGSVEPERFTAEDFLRVARPAGVRRAVLVQPSLLGYDNTSMLDAIRAHPGVFGAVALVDLGAPGAPREMGKLASAGVRGFRLPARDSARSWLDSRAMCRAWDCAAELQAAISLHVNPSDLPAVRKMCAKFPLTSVVTEHLGRIGMDGNIRHADIDSLCALAECPHVYVKLSAFYALGKRQPGFPNLDEMVARVLAAFGPGRLMWGSDAPFQLLNGRRYQESLDFLFRQAGIRRPADTDLLLRQTAETLFFR